MLTEQRRLESTEHFVLPQDGELRQAIVMLNVLRPPGRVSAKTKCLDRTYGQTAKRVRVRAVCAEQQESVLRHQVRQPAKRQQYRIEIGVDIRVIELDVPDDRDVREVLEELGRPVEERAVVFVTLDHEVAAPPNSIARPMLPEVEGDAANQQ